ncbi:MSHA biogenesis protein MshO [Paucimonas lemoignei]|uniref:MSHA biogenesis protein MshO n=1 Tax=Paucimonas lemoignei TaxID=29443 RepID=A0A4R3I076_PAULE|nr:prepilin-type N-terminal cleavage/methylation domain-containing protein [Paucimonas lemoignei]TCS39077.1 MSHA biogenesis protein MshO [Paucimonas lemoignei]
MRQVNPLRHRYVPARSRDRGFTLAEAIIVIVITGIISAIVATFIVKPVEGYTQAVARAETTDVADNAMRRIARDIRLALPNSIRVSADQRSLELLLTKTGGRYLDVEDMQPVGNILNFEASGSCLTTPANCRFDVVGLLPTGSQAIVPGDQIVVYNLGGNFASLGADAYSGGNRAAVSAVNAATGTVTLAANPFAAQATPMKSPAKRFQVVTTPVTYHCNVGTGGTSRLMRYWNYPITALQQSPANVATNAGNNNAILANGVQDCRFDYQTLRNINSGLIGIRITMAPTAGSGQIDLVHQVHVDNTP